MRDGLHNFWDTCTITDHHRAVRNFETRYGYFELRARVPDDSGLHSAWWMIGTEAKSDETAEVDILKFVVRTSIPTKAAYAFPSILGTMQVLVNKAQIIILLVMFRKIFTFTVLNGSRKA